MRIGNFFMRAWRWLKRNVELYVKRDPFLVALRRWHRDGGDERLRLDYSLGPGSTVIDVGGYRGDWAQRMIERYGCTVHIFEAIPSFAREIHERFRGYDNVTTHEFGLSGDDRVVSMSLAADGSSAFRSGADRVDVRLRDIDSVLRENGIDEIDLIKINIEGGEYPLLRRMLDSGIVERCRDIQVQFHLDYPDAVHLRDELRGELQRTHELTYDYYFVWENWHRRGE
jgi:FkbM family methyltransferase